MEKRNARSWPFVHQADSAIMQESVDTYGTNTLRILERLQPYRQLGVPEDLACVLAQLRYCAEEEMTVTAYDFLRLRTGWSYFNEAKAEQCA
jgi:glycerol-3-phosphate dehydrogenase